MRAPAGAPPASVRMNGSEALLRIAPAKLGRTAAVVVLADFLDAGERRELAATLKARLARTPRNESLAITVLRGGELIPLPPVKTAAALEKELAWAAEGEGGDGVPGGRDGLGAGAEALYDLLLGTAPEGQESWREWVWAGRLPAPREGLVRRFLRAKLARLLGEMRLRLVVWPEQEAKWLPVWTGSEKEKWLEGEWEAPPAAEGFEIREAEVAGEAMPVLALAPGFRAPSVAALAPFLDIVEEVSGEQAGEQQLLALRQGLEIYPNFVPALEAGARLAERLENHGAAADLLARLERFRPGDANLLRRRAVACWKGKTSDAEAVLRRAVEAMPKDAELLEWLARLRLAAGDVKESYGLLLRSLEVRPDSDVLWWIAADLAKELGDEAGERRALREALNREPGRADRRVRLIELALRAGDAEGARRALIEAETLPTEDAGILESYASGWEKLREREKALEYWKKTAAAAPGYEPARLAVCRLLEEKEAWEESLKAAEEGLEALPASPGLHLARARALERLGRIQDARRALREASAATGDAAVLEARARLEELFGGRGAVQAWGALLNRLEGEGAEAERREPVRKKALQVALREGDAAEAARLLQLPEADAAASSGAGGERGVVIPGGMRLLNYLSGIGGPEDPREYLAAFARAVTQRTLIVAEKQWNEYRERVIEHYDRLMKLREPFPLTHEGTEVVLEAKTPAQRRQAQRVLDLLGYRLRTRRGGVEVEARTGSDEARRQTLAAGLELDERAVEESLAGGKAYRFRIQDDLAQVVPGERAWAAMMKRHANPLGFAGMLVLEPALARLYAGLVSAGQAAAEALTARISIQKLAEDNGLLLYLYGPAMSLDERGRCPVPGGESAEAVWQAMAGVSPREGARFLEALLKKDDGMLLAFFAAMHGVTEERQRWFLRDVERARKFYRIMKDAPEWGGKGGRMVRESPILTLFRELPLEEDGSVRFPGGPQVWQVARGVSDVSRIARLERKAQRARPAEEEEILERMARERYREGRQRFSQLENFLMVVRMEEALGRRLEPREALILTQQFSRYEWGYPLLTALSGLGEKELLAFFAWAESLEQLDWKMRNLSIGLVSHVALLEGLLQRAGRLEAGEAAAILGELCASMRGVEDPGRMADAAQKALSRIATALGARAGGLQQALEDALLGREESAAGRRQAQTRREPRLRQSRRRRRSSRSCNCRSR